MVALLLYAYARGNRSSRGIERACQEDVAFKVLTIDGTKTKANASMDQNRSYRELVGQILREAEETDQREDELYGKDRRGDELPEPLRTPEGRRQALAEAKRRLAERKGRPIAEEPIAELEIDLEQAVLARPVLRRGGRRSAGVRDPLPAALHDQQRLWRLARLVEGR